MSAGDIDFAVRALEWTVLGTTIAGNMLATFALADYIGDRIVLGHNGDLGITANIGIRTSAMLSLVFLMFLAYAIYALLGPLPIPSREVRALVGMGIAEAIVLALTIMKGHNVLDRIQLLRIRKS